MPSRINHVKVRTREPAVINAFLTQVCDVPEGWPLGANSEVLPVDAPLGPGGELPRDIIGQGMERSESSGSTGTGGFIVGDPTSRQFQVFPGAPDFWAVCIATRDVEGVYERAKARGVPCTSLEVADWNERDNIVNFFCIVGELMFEIIRVEPKQPAS